MEGHPVNLWLDDIRPAPEGWVWAKTADEAVGFLEEGDVVRCSLDHDLDGGDAPSTGPYGSIEPNGTDLANWMVNYLPPAKWPHTIYIHSHNQSGAETMRNKLRNYGPGLLDVFIHPFDEHTIKRLAIRTP